MTSPPGFEFIDRYRRAASAYGAALERGDSDRANHEFDMLETLRLELDTKHTLVRTLQPLLKDDDEGVRLCSAVHLLRECPNEAAKVLDDLSQRGSTFIR